ncbi:MAG: DoxX family protein [Chitinophagaceae bacterium]|nr:DoxX family protein [Chitinophagaceae bacterium]
MSDIALPSCTQDVALLLVRIILFVTFLAESRHKFKDIKGFAKNDGVPLPVAYVVATAELLAAIGMLTGFLAQLAGIGIVLLMIGTTYMQIFKWHSPYWANQKGWEYDVIMLVLGAVIAAFGAGRISLDALLH